MTARRALLSAAALAAATPMLARTASAQTSAVLPANAASTGSQRWRPPQRIGMGGNALGNGLGQITPDSDALGAMQAAWDNGIRLFDTSPWYGLGLSERRMGVFLGGKPREDFTLSTKIGRVLDPDQKLGLQNDVGAWRNAPPFRYRYDYTADGVRRSVEDSLQRMGLSRIDIVYIHDLAPSNADLGERWREQFEIARKGAMPALTRMREEGLIKAWGLGINDPEPGLMVLEAAEPDILLAATQYSLADHAEALRGLLPACQRRGVSIMVGAPLNAGFLSGRNRFNYGRSMPAAMVQKRQRLQAIAQAQKVDLRSAALHFANAHPAVSCIIPGARNAEQARQNAESMRGSIPSDFWGELKEANLIEAQAPTPV